MSNQPAMADLLLNKECPFDYQCKALDCLECAEIHKEEQNNGD